jgi:hypothetical protein
MNNFRLHPVINNISLNINYLILFFNNFFIKKYFYDFNEYL